MNPKVDAFLSRAKNWPQEMKKLRTIVLDCGLIEELKWGKPCYTFQGTNLVVIQGFKAYCALLFMKGVLLDNTDGLLVKTGENTRVGRQIRFNNVKEIVKAEAVIKAYIYQAIEVEKAGVKVEAAKKIPLNIPEEFQQRLDKHPALKTAFNTLTPGRQRAYNIYFATPKQSKTRESRIEKCLQQILKGKGLND
jgi:uncharacterized protein YdeI (YjbR/CyaY-like superfamily)